MVNSERSSSGKKPTPTLPMSMPVCAAACSSPPVTTTPIAIAPTTEVQPPSVRSSNRRHAPNAARPDATVKASSTTTPTIAAGP